MTGGSSGLRARRICLINIRPLTSASAPHPVGSTFRPWRDVRPLAAIIVAPRNVAESAAPGVSKGALTDALFRGSDRHASQRATAPGMTLMANSHCQPSASTIVPPRTGPMALLEAMSRACSPRMRPSSRPGNTERRIAGAMLSVAAPPIPCKTRIAVSSSGVFARAQPADVSVEVARPARKTGRYPTRAASAAKIASIIAAESR